MRTTIAILLSVYAVSVFGGEPSHPATCPDGSPGHPCGTDGCRPGYKCLRGQCCRKPNGDCPSGVIGPECSDYNPCKPGYDCRRERCCRKQSSCASGIDGPVCSEDKPCTPGYICKRGRCCAVCPKGRKEGGPCNRTPGEPRCPPSHSCINDLCCDAERMFGGEPSYPTTCPDGSPGHPCGTDGCRPGYKCFRGQCCRQPNGDCPSGVIGPVCSDYNPCKTGYDCRRERCCRKQSSCSSGIDGPACSEDKPCKPGYACRRDRCCAVCPKGRKEGGPCNRTPGEPRCPPSHSCINDLCCDAERISGRCPIPLPDGRFFCIGTPVVHLCFHDDDCNEDQFCCPNACGNRRCTIGFEGRRTTPRNLVEI